MFLLRFLIRFFAAGCLPVAVFYLLSAGVMKLVLFIAALTVPIAVFAKLASELGALSSDYISVAQNADSSKYQGCEIHPYGNEIDGVLMLD